MSPLSLGALFELRVSLHPEMTNKHIINGIPTSMNFRYISPPLDKYLASNVRDKESINQLDNTLYNISEKFAELPISNDRFAATNLCNYISDVGRLPTSDTSQ